MTSISAAEIVRRASVALVAGETVDLSRLVVAEPLDLRGVRLANVDFSGARFCAPVDARGAVFGGLAWFRDAIFEASADFTGAIFHNDLRLDRAKLKAHARLSAVELYGVLSLDHAVFAGRADLDGMIVYGNVSMAGTRFDGPVTLQDSEMLGGLWLDGAGFRSKADFLGVEVHGRTWLAGSSLAAGAVAMPESRQTRDIVSYGYRWTAQRSPLQDDSAKPAGRET